MKKAGSQPSVAQSPATSPVKGAAPAQATPQPQGGQPAPQQASPQQPAQAPAAGGASVAELQANLARVTEERDQLRKQRDGMSQKSYELEDELDKVRAEKQQLAKKVDELQKEVQSLKSSSSSSSHGGGKGGMSDTAGLSASSSSSGLVPMLQQRLMEEHRAREELEEKYAALAEQWGRVKEADEWAEVAGNNNHRAAEAERRRYAGPGGEVAKQVLQAYQRKVKEAYALAQKLEGLSNKLEGMRLNEAAEQIGRSAARLQHAASESS